MGREHGAFEFALHEANRPLEGFCHVVVRLHERILSVRTRYRLADCLDIRLRTLQDIGTHVTFSFRVCFSRTADERRSSSRRDTCCESIARFDANTAARMSLRSLYQHTLNSHPRLRCATQRAPGKGVFELFNDAPQLPARALRPLVLHCNVKRLLRYVLALVVILASATHLNLLRKRV